MKKWYAVIGDPISHSLSPYMHDEWFRENGINASYIPVHVRTGELKEAVSSLKRLGVSGFNITLPFKQEIVGLLDELDETALEMNAVNTVVCENGRLAGYNTDGDGFVRALMPLEPELSEPVLIAGAGGAARGIVFALKRRGFTNISITNRTHRRAAELAAAAGADALSTAEAESRLDRFRVVINTTSAGLTDESVPLSLENLKADTLVSDIIYSPLETPFLKHAAGKGCRVQNGIGMFVHQGAVAFEKWTGIVPDTAAMEERITAKLGGTYANR